MHLQSSKKVFFHLFLAYPLHKWAQGQKEMVTTENIIFCTTILRVYPSNWPCPSSLGDFPPVLCFPWTLNPSDTPLLQSMAAWISQACPAVDVPGQTLDDSVMTFGALPLNPFFAPPLAITKGKSSSLVFLEFGA